PASFLALRAPLKSGIALALGGGFARGYAHLGVLRVFAENNIPISCLTGSSIGSIIAAAYASGTPLPRIISKCREVRFRDFAKWRVLAWQVTNGWVRWCNATLTASSSRT